MPLLFTDPCENTSVWTPQGTVNIVPARVGNGIQPAQNTPNAVVYDLAVGAQTDTLTVGGWFNFNFMPASTSLTWLRFRSDSGSRTHMDVRYYDLGDIGAPDEGGFTVWRGDGSQLATTFTPCLDTNTWHFVEVSCTLHETAGRLEIRVDGTSRLVWTGDTRNAGTKAVFDRISFNGNVSGLWTMDDTYLRNDTVFSSTDARVARTSTRAPTVGAPTARVARTSARTAMIPPPSVARVSGVSERTLTILATEGQLARISTRILVAIVRQATVEWWNGSEFVTCPVRTWDGTDFVASTAVRTWGGSQWVESELT